MNVKTSEKQVKKKQVPVAIIHISAGFNNTIVTVTNAQGDKLTSSSGGASGFKNSKKSTPFAGQLSAENAFSKAVLNHGVKTASIRIKGPGAARESAIKALSKIINEHGITITSIKDVTKIPHNGCRPPKKRNV